MDKDIKMKVMAEICTTSQPLIMHHVQPEKIIGENNLLPIWFLRKGVESAKSVCHLTYSESGQNYAATGFMISPSLLMTNHHVFGKAEQARNAKAVFNYEEPEPSKKTLAPIEINLIPNNFFYANEELDIAIVAVENTKHHDLGNIVLMSAADKAGIYERVNIIQHPEGRRKQISLQENTITQFFEDKIHYLTDTNPGSSGSPVFDNKWQLVAIHHAGNNKINEGIRISSICAHLKNAIGSNVDTYGKQELHLELLKSII